MKAMILGAVLAALAVGPALAQLAVGPALAQDDPITKKYNQIVLDHEWMAQGNFAYYFELGKKCGVVSEQDADDAIREVFYEMGIEATELHMSDDTSKIYNLEKDRAESFSANDCYGIHPSDRYVIMDGVHSYADMYRELNTPKN